MMKYRSILLIMALSYFGVAHAKVLDTLIIDGLELNRSGVVRNTVTLRSGRPFITEDVQESIRKLHELGLFNTIEFFIVEENDSTVALRLQLEEYPLCEGVELSGNKKIKEKEMKEAIDVRPGQIATDHVIFKSEQTIKDLYEEKGYLRAKVETKLIPTKVPGNTLVKFEIDEGPKVQVKTIAFNGNIQLTDSKLRKKLKTKENRWWRSGDFDEELYEKHLDTLMQFYHDQGYLDAAVVKDSVWYGKSKKDIYIEITVEEGPEYYVGEFFFKGNKVLPTDSLSNKITLKKGKPFKKDRFQLTKELIGATYREEGYLWVQLNEQRSFRGDTIDVTFDIYEGRPAIVRKIDVTGNSKTMEKVIRREIALLPGEKYKQSLMAQTHQNLHALNYFDGIRPDMEPNEDGTIDLVFDITEKDNIGQLSIGAAYSQVDNFVGTFSTAIPNFRGAGQELKVNLEYGGSRADLRLGFTEPWAFDTPTFLSGNIFGNRTEYPTETTISYGFEIGVGRSKLKWPDNHFKINGWYQLSFDRSSRKPDTLDNLIVSNEGYLSRLTFGIERYDLDMPLFPTQGSRLSITPQIAGLGGDYKYLKTTMKYEHYFPLPWKFVLGSRTKFGHITTSFGDNIQISHMDLFRLGGVYGDGDLRGYPEYSIGGWHGNPRNGITMFTSTMELRYPILDQQLYAGVFADVGNTWSSLADMDLTNLYKGVGVGVRLNMPMLGIMGLDFGWGLDKERNKGAPEIHFLMNRGF